MSSGKSNQNQAKPPVNDAWQEAQRSVRDRNDEARRAGKKERLEDERRAQAGQRARDLRDGVMR